MKYVNINGKRIGVKKSNRKNKKFVSLINGKEIHFGEKGMRIYPGTKRGNNYCARSSGIKNLRGITANDLSRAMWRCDGKKSLK